MFMVTNFLSYEEFMSETELCLEPNCKSFYTSETVDFFNSISPTVRRLLRPMAVATKHLSNVVQLMYIQLNSIQFNNLYLLNKFIYNLMWLNWAYLQGNVQFERGQFLWTLTHSFICSDGSRSPFCHVAQTHTFVCRFKLNGTDGQRVWADGNFFWRYSELWLRQ